jgi:hypothetical protein
VVVGVGELEGLARCVREGVGVPVMEVVAVGVMVLVALREGVLVPVAVPETVLLLVPLTEGVLVLVGDTEGVPVEERVGLGLCVRDGETDEQELGLVLSEALAQCEAEEQ